MTTEHIPTDPQRIRAFASFFKSYMSVSAVVVAALPIPVTSLGLIPTFADQRMFLTTYTSLFCFLTLGFVFYLRHSFARWMFPEETSSLDAPSGRRLFNARRFLHFFISIAPFIFIASSLGLVFWYHSLLDDAIFEITKMLGRPKPGMDECPNVADAAYLLAYCLVPSPKEVLSMSFTGIPHGVSLMAAYLSIFIAAELAFVLMATKEYIQDLMRLTDIEIIRGVRASSSP